MSVQAFGEREYFGATYGASISLREHAEEPSSALGPSEVLRVKTPPGPVIPDVCQGMEDAREIAVFVGREQVRNVFPHKETRAKFGEDEDEFIK
jgi:hypothetical protein